FDEVTALVSVVLLGLSGPFNYSSHLARYDIAAAALGYASIALYVVPGPRRPIRAFLAGLLAGIALECHPFAIVIVTALSVLALSEFRSRILAVDVARYLGVGLCLGALVYPAIHILPAPATYRELTRIIYGPTHTPFLLELSSAGAESIRLVVMSFGLLSPVLLWGFLTLWDKSDSDRRLLVSSGAILGAFTIVVRNKLPYYAILFSPLLMVCVARVLLTIPLLGRGRPLLRMFLVT